MVDGFLEGLSRRKVVSRSFLESRAERLGVLSHGEPDVCDVELSKFVWYDRPQSEHAKKMQLGSQEPDALGYSPRAACW